jgi:hypothetical protein
LVDFKYRDIANKWWITVQQNNWVVYIYRPIASTSIKMPVQNSRVNSASVNINNVSHAKVSAYFSDCHNYNVSILFNTAIHHHFTLFTLLLVVIMIFNSSIHYCHYQSFIFLCISTKWNNILLWMSSLFYIHFIHFCCKFYIVIKDSLSFLSLIIHHYCYQSFTNIIMHFIINHLLH